ncbi:MAG: hypothetical protein Cons2KO_16900 [Congregibacter sp.]
MTMFRQSPPEYRALVVENERDFRGDLIYTIESLDIGINVVGEAADYEDARQIIDSGEVDLLVTDINLTDAPRFRVGHQDGTELAQYARDRYGIPCIFLTAFADYDPEVVTRAAASDPIGFIQKQGSEVGVQTQHLIRLALRRLELIRRERETTRQLTTIIEQLGKALLYIDLDGQILDFNEAFANLIGRNGEEIIDQHWEDVVRIENPSGDENPLTPLIESGSSGRLTALALNRADGDSALISVRVTQTEHLREPCTLLIVQELSDKLTEFRALRVEPNATLLTFGIHATGGTDSFDASELRMTMLRLRAILIEAVRTGDFVSRPMNTLVAVRLLETELSAGMGIAQTLYDKLVEGVCSEHPKANIRVGVAWRGPGDSSHATIASALGALDSAQRDNSKPIVAADSASQAQDIALSSSPRRDDPVNRNRSFELASRLLDVGINEAHSIAALTQALDGCFQDSEHLTSYMLFCPSHGELPTLTFYREKLEKLFVDAEPSTNLTRYLERKRASLAADSDEIGPCIAFDRFRDCNFSLLRIQEIGREGGYLVMCSEDADGAGFPPADENEEQLASLAAQHLNRLIKQARKAPLSRRISDQSTYNPYSLRGDLQTVEAAALLYKLDVPIALVSEAGMCEGKLLRHVFETSPLEKPKQIRFESCEAWSEATQRDAFRRLLASLDGTFIVFVDPRKLHPELQGLLAETIKNRTVGTEQGSHSVANLRLAVTLRDSPEALVKRGE